MFVSTRLDNEHANDDEKGDDDDNDNDDDDNQPEDLYTSSLSFTIEMNTAVEEEKERQKRRAEGLPELPSQTDSDSTQKKKFKKSAYFSDEEELDD